eukprot:g4334.t1
MLTFNQLSERYKCKIEVLSGGINQGTKGGGGNFERLKAAEGDMLLSVRFPFVFKEPCLKLFSPERGGLGVWNIHPGALPGYAGLQAIKAGESSIGATLHQIDDGRIDTGPVVCIEHFPVDRKRSVLWHTAQVYQGGVNAFLNRVLPLFENGRRTLGSGPEGALATIESVQVHAQPEGDHPYFSNPSEQEVCDAESAGIRFSSRRDFDELISKFDLTSMVATHLDTKNQEEDTLNKRNAAEELDGSGSSLSHANMGNVHNRQQLKAYVLGGFGGEAGLDITAKLFKTGRNIYGDVHKGQKLPRNMSDSNDIRFVLDSHPGDHGHVTTDACVAPLQSGLNRAAAHLSTLVPGDEVDDEQLNCSLLVGIGCNTMHTAIPLVKIPAGITLVDIVESTILSTIETIDRISKHETPRVFLWSTRETAMSRLYHDKLNRMAGLQFTEPASFDDTYKELDNIILHTKMGNMNEAVRRSMQLVETYKLDDVDSPTIIVLGCTELPLVYNAMLPLLEKKDNRDFAFVDCNEALSRGIVREYKRRLFQSSSMRGEPTYEMPTEDCANNDS